MSAPDLPYVGFKKHRPGKIHLFCPGCGLKRSNMNREEHDPPTAVLAHIPCERCSAGCKVEGASDYLDAKGKSVAWTTCPSCGEAMPYFELKWHQLDEHQPEVAL